MSKIVAYHNKFNSSFVDPLTSTEQNCLYALFHKLKDKGGDIIEISKKELIALTGFKKGGERSFEDYILTAIGTLQNLKLRNTVDNKIITQFTIFPKLQYDREKEMMSVKVAQDFEPYINNLGGDFTNFTLEEFVSVKGKYAKTLYRRLKQYNSLGVAILDFDELVKQMGIPESYSTSKIDSIILKPAMNELSEDPKEPSLFPSEKPFENLKYEKIKKKSRGGKIEKLKFTWKPITNGILEAFKTSQDFKKWLFKSVDSGDFYTNIFIVDGKTVSIARFERKEDANYNGSKIVLDFDTYTDKDEGEKIIERIFTALIDGGLEPFLIKENNPNNHSTLFLQAISKKMTDQEKLKMCNEESRELFKALLELKGKKLTLPITVTNGFFEEDEVIVIQDVFIQYATKEPCVVFSSETRQLERNTPIKDPNSVSILKKQIEKLASKDSIIEGFLL